MRQDIVARIMESGLEPLGFYKAKNKRCHVIASRATAVDYGDKSGFRLDAWTISSGNAEMTHTATLVFTVSRTALATKRVKNITSERPGYLKEQALARMKQMLDTDVAREDITLLSSSPLSDFEFSYPGADPVQQHRALRDEILQVLIRVHLAGKTSISLTELQESLCASEEWTERAIGILAHENLVDRLSDGSLQLTPPGYVAAEKVSGIATAKDAVKKKSDSVLAVEQSQPPEFEYDVALSFAGEERDYVHQLAQVLRAREIRVFYDEFEEANLWGKDLYAYLSDIYQHKARHTVIFASAAYAKKSWTNLERRAAQARAISEASDYILPVRFDNTEIPGLLSTTGYLSAAVKTPEQLADAICKKLSKP